MTDHQPKPSALFLMSPQCPFCPAVMEGLTRLVKEGLLGKLEIINLFQHPEMADKLGVRTVPWARIGPYEIDGNHTYSELRQWAEEAADEGGMTGYYSQLLESRQLQKVIEKVRAAPKTLSDLIVLLNTLDTPMAVRIGIGAVLEEFSGETTLDDIVPELIRLTASEERQIRADACHYLSLSRSREALAAINALKEDPAPEVRDIAVESAAALKTVLH